MLNIARKCVPYTPFDKPLSSATVALITATGVHLADQEPFSSDDAAEPSYYVIPGDTQMSDLRIAHRHYDHSEADSDPNIVFPLETLRALAQAGVIAGVAERNYSYGFTTRLRELYETTFPDIADRVERSRTKLVLLTAGCPETCHRTIANLAREIEARGVPTLILSASPAATAAVHPPRAMTFEGSSLGQIIGKARNREQHSRVLRTALHMFVENTPPGRVVTKIIQDNPA